MKNFLVSYFTQIATYTTIIVIFTHNVLFDREVACTCKDQEFHCNLYISLPIFIIFLLLIWKDQVFNATCRAYCCMKKRRKSQESFWYLILIQMGKASVIGLLWVVSVLFDGDWYACCLNGLPKEEAQIPCRTNRTLGEQATIDNLKNESKLIGLGVLLVLLFLVVCFSLLKRPGCCKEDSCCFKCCNKDSCCFKCCNKDSSCCKCCRKCSSYFDGVEPYELIIIKEEENIVNQILKERAKEALTQKVKQILEETNETKDYMKCYEAAQQVIDEVWPEQGSSTGDPPSDQPSGSKDKKAEIHEDVLKLTGNVSITHSPGEKENEEQNPTNEHEGDSLMPAQGTTSTS